MGNVLLYYKYVDIAYPKHIMKWQKKICHDLSLTGRIIIGHEGINGTVGGTQKNTELYQAIMQKNSLFNNIDFKQSKGDADCFSRLSVIVKNEIVNLGLDPYAITADKGGKHLTPDKAHALIKQHPSDLLIFDIRNKIEWEVGYFQRAIKLDINHFRELPKYINTHLDQFKDKQVLMYCTGGIRCERASTYLKSKNITKQVYQIEGGIHRYVEQYPNGFFRGKNYVFDNRITLKVTDEILGTCLLCTTSCDNYTNCSNAKCNKHFICCDPCSNKFHNTCNTVCHDLVKQNKVNKRPTIKKVPNYVSRKISN